MSLSSELHPLGTPGVTIGPVADWVSILEGLRAGDMGATHQVIALITRHLHKIGAYKYRDSWEDLAQEVLITLIESPPNVQVSGAIVRHIQTTTYRRYVDEIRREQGRRRAGTGTEGAAAEQGQGWRRKVSLDEVAEVSDSEDFWQQRLDPGLRSALDGLDARKRDVVVSRYLLGCTNEEGSSRLGIPLGTYKRLLGQAVKELRARLMPAEETP